MTKVRLLWLVALAVLVIASSPFALGGSVAFGRPGAANAVADLVMALAQRRPLPTPEAIDRASRAAA